MRLQRGWPWARLAAAVLLLAALAAQLRASVTLALDQGRDLGPTVVNFFSFFTVLSNLGAAAVLAHLAWASVRRSGPVTRAEGIALACVATAMLVTGVVYNLLLRSIELPQGTTVPWSNEVLHVVGPLFMLVDLLVAPGVRRLAWTALGWVLAFPLAWTAYTLIRGPLAINPVTGSPPWYPYPFLNPQVSGGWLGVLGYVAGIAVAFAALGADVIAVTRRRDRRVEDLAVVGDGS